MTTQNALELHRVCKSYGDFTLADITFSLPKGCIMGLAGANGAGKTTTIKLLLDLIRRDSGEVRVLGQDPAEAGRNLKEDLGVVLDETCFPETLTLKETERILRAVFRRWDSSAFFGYADRFGLPEKKKICTFSKGMKTKLNLAAALSHGASLLLLDEATSGLDPVMRDELLELFLSFIQDESCAVLLSSHIVSDLEKACDYITFLHEGRLVFSRPKDELLEQFSVLKCDEALLNALPAGSVRGIRRHRFGAEVLMLREHLPAGEISDPASLEDIILYHVKGDSK